MLILYIDIISTAEAVCKFLLYATMCCPDQSIRIINVVQIHFFSEECS